MIGAKCVYFKHQTKGKKIKRATTAQCLEMMYEGYCLMENQWKSIMHGRHLKRRIKVISSIQKINGKFLTQ